MANATRLLTTTYETGGTTKPAEAVYANPERARHESDLASFAGGAGHAAFLADFLSAVLMHEQCGRHLYRSIAQRTNNPILKRHYAHFGDETEEHIVVLRDLVTALGGDAGYVSPSARGTEKLDQGALEATYALDGSLDLMTRELVMLDAVVLAETIDLANWQVLEELVDTLDGTHRDALARALADVLNQEKEHIGWAAETRRRMVMMQAKHPAVAGLASGAEAAIDWIRDLFADDPAMSES